MKRYIDPKHGCDENSGLSDAPWKSLQGLTSKLLKIRKAYPFPNPIEVVLADGQYALQESLCFNEPALGGVTLRAENTGGATISGGKSLTGFEESTVNGKRVWTLTLPEVRSRESYYRQLFVDGVRRPRARYPKFDAVEKCFELSTLSEINTYGRTALDLELHQGDNRFKLDIPEELKSADWRQAEAVLLHFWVDERMPDLFLNPKDGWLETSHKTVFNLREAFNEKLSRVYLDNLSSALTDPGEWFLDADTGLLTYLPKDGEVLGEVEIVVPVLNQFFVIQGQPHLGDYIEHLTLEGLNFEYADWCNVEAFKDRNDYPNIVERPFSGDCQNSTHLKGSISMRGCRHIQIAECSVSKVGFFAIGVEHASEKVEIRHCEMRDLGGGGVKITGSDAYEVDWSATKEVTVADCEIHQGGRVFHTAPGIVMKHAAHNRILHNHISDFYNSGIACGCVWAYEKTRSFENLIIGNHVHDLGQGLLNDMGGIYILGIQQGTIVRNNWVYSIRAEDYGAHGIYLDESCSHVVVEKNVAHDVDGVTMLIHRGRENVIRNNIFANGKHGIIEQSNVDEHAGFTFIRNIVISDGESPVVLGGYACEILKVGSVFEANLYWAGQTGAAVFGDVRFEQEPHYEGVDLNGWKEAGYDCMSLEEDPQLEGLGTVNLKVDVNSPARRFGFVDIDLAKCGPRAEGSEEESESFVASTEMKFG